MDISVVIRNRNEGAHLRHVLRALSLQDTPAQVILWKSNQSRYTLLYTSD
jgi:hypothetical protein